MYACYTSQCDSTTAMLPTLYIRKANKTSPNIMLISYIILLYQQEFTKTSISLYTGNITSQLVLWHTWLNNHIKII